MTRFPHVEIDGGPPTVEALLTPALVNYGHLTVMQIRGRRTRGLSLHLARLDAANRELYGTGLDGELIKDRIRHALGDDVDDATARISVFRPDPAAGVSVMVVLRPPAAAPDAPQSLRSVRYQRPAAHLKHAGTFPLIYFGALAEREGFDDALLTGHDGVISEGGITNIGFFDGTSVIWPDAPLLHGITMQLLESRLADLGVPGARRTVRLSDLASYRAAFVTNSRGVAPVGRIDDQKMAADPEFIATVTEAYASVPWDAI